MGARDATSAISRAAGARDASSAYAASAAALTFSGSAASTRVVTTGERSPCRIGRTTAWDAGDRFFTPGAL